LQYAARFSLSVLGIGRLPGFHRSSVRPEIGMLEKGIGLVVVVDKEREFEVEMIFADSEGHQQYRMIGPGLSVVFTTTRQLQTNPPTWWIRLQSTEDSSMPEQQLRSIIEEVVSFMAARLLRTEPGNVIARFHPGGPIG
jgi:hypothetical protein